MALVSQPSLMWMTPGQQVYIRDVSVIAYINMHWVVEEAPREGRVVLRAKIEEGDIEKLIRVKVEKDFEKTKRHFGNFEEARCVAGCPTPTNDIVTHDISVAILAEV